MKKFIKSILICLLVAVVINAINMIYTKPAEAKWYSNSTRLEYVQDVGTNLKIYRDTKTNVCYLVLDWKNGTAGQGGICVMVDKDGKPLLYNE